MNDDDLRSNDDVEALLQGVGPRPEAPPERKQRVRGVVENHWRQKVRARKRRRFWLAATGVAAAALVATVGASVWRLEPAPTIAVVERSLAGAEPETGEGILAGATLHVPDGSGLALRLFDGPSLRLDEGTRVVLLSGDTFRLERGGLYFDSDGRRSVVTIETPLGSTRNHGTQFETRFEDDTLRVRVREGAVSVTGEGGRARLIAGEGIRLDRTGDWDRHRVSAHDDSWSWASSLAPTFLLPGESLASFLAWAARESGIRLEYGSDALEAEAGGVALEGSIEELTPREAIDAILPTTGLLHTLRLGVLRVEAPGEPVEVQR